MKRSILTGLIILSMVLCSSWALAYDYSGFGTNITVYDGNGDGSEAGWYKGKTPDYADISYEDQEVERVGTDGTRAIATQAWDMEAFFWNNSENELTMVGGYDLINGTYHEDGTVETTPGDIFIDVFGNTGGIDVNGQNYDYAIHFDDSGSASVYKLTSASILTDASVGDFQFSNPVALSSGGILMTGTYNSVYSSGLDDGTGITGGSHNAISIDLTGLDLGLDPTDGTGFAAHFTMSCGNDMIKGSYGNQNDTPVPIPAAIWLLGSGLLGLVGIRRRRQS